MTRPYLAKSSPPADSVEFVPANVRYLQGTLAELNAQQARLREQYASLEQYLSYKQALNQSIRLQQEQRYCDLEQELARLKQQIRTSRGIYADLLKQQQNAHDAVYNARVNEELSRQNQWLAARVEELRAECDVLVKQDAEKEAEYSYQKQALEGRFSTQRSELYQRISAAQKALAGAEEHNEALRCYIQAAKQRNADLEADISQQTSRARELRGLVLQAAALDLPGKAVMLQKRISEHRGRAEVIYRLGAEAQTNMQCQKTNRSSALAELAGGLQINGQHADQLNSTLAALAEALDRFAVIETEIYKAADCIYGPAADFYYYTGSDGCRGGQAAYPTLQRENRLKDAADAEQALQQQLSEEQSRLLDVNYRLDQQTALAASIAERETALGLELAQSQAETARAGCEQLQGALKAYQAENAALQAQIAEVKARIAAKNQ